MAEKLAGVTWLFEQSNSFDTGFGTEHPPFPCSHPPHTHTQHYLAHDQKLKRFVPLIKDSLVYPAIYDADRTLLSLPPIINGAATAVRGMG